MSIRIQQKLLTSDTKETASIITLAKELNGKGLLRTTDLMMMISDDRAGDIFTRWNIAKSAKIPDGDYKGDVVRRQKDSLIGAMVNQDAEKALSTLIAQNDSNLFPDVNAAISKWTQIDSQGAATWYSNHQSKMTPIARDAVASSFASAAAKSSEFSSAEA